MTTVTFTTPDEVRANASVSIARVYADAAGESHFDTWQWLAVATELAPPAPPVFVTAPEPARSTLLLRLPPGWSCQPHPAPGRHLMVILCGTLESTASDGEVRRFPPGSAVLVEDTTGHGHSIGSVDGEVVVAVTQLDGEAT